MTSQNRVCDAYPMRHIQRVGKVTGRWPRYRLIVDGVDVGEVRRTTATGSDRLTPHVRYDGWRIAGVVAESQGEAETQLINRAIRFGHLSA